MSNIELNIIALSASESSKGNYVIILEETTGYRRLNVIIGLHEAQCIAIPLEKLATPRPLTHDLLLNSIQALGAKLDHIIIHKVEHDIYEAQLIYIDKEKNKIFIDSRVSDAIALAIRVEALIYCTEDVMEKASLKLSNPSESFANKRGRLSDYTLNELNQILKQVLKKEDFESAAKVRDAIKKKTEGGGSPQNIDF